MHNTISVIIKQDIVSCPQLFFPSLHLISWSLAAADASATGIFVETQVVIVVVVAAVVAEIAHIVFVITVLDYVARKEQIDDSEA